MDEHGPIRMVKSTVVQMICLTSSLLFTVPTQIQLMKDHSQSNPVEMERLRKMLDKKEVALVERVKEVNHWVKKEVDT